jgi:hypothetical protein
LPAYREQTAQGRLYVRGLEVFAIVDDAQRIFLFAREGATDLFKEMVIRHCLKDGDTIIRDDAMTERLARCGLFPKGFFEA